VLLGAVLAPTDPVLASDVQVGGPTTEQEDGETIDEDDEVRFALTSEAGLNDGLAFPFVALAILMAGTQSIGSWSLTWLLWDLAGKVIVGAAVGILVGWLLAKAAFRARQPSARMAEIGEPLLAIAAVLVSYGSAEVVGGYGFLSVFACALTIRSAERNSSYHALMHEVIERLERLLTLIVLLLLGIALTGGVLANLTWRGAAIGVLLLFVVRPLSAWVGLRFLHRRVLEPRERWATAFFGVRGIGSLYYLAYAMGHGTFAGPGELWSTVTFTVTLSVLVHGISATPVMRRLDERRDTASD
jgi:NhaP-type Na+/H+ or K+/H+ antiporter